MHHLRIAIGSEAELQTQIELSARRGYITSNQARSVLQRSNEVARMLNGLHSALKARQTRNRTTLATSVLVLLYATQLL